ncbi:MAG: hypothetical protein PHN47_07220 [Clostridia bacterium]|nr:hypothetical protein [Clostridia bacterium]MDD4572250.1 hypothetical protein [Clostridia bacterium]
MHTARCCIPWAVFIAAIVGIVMGLLFICHCTPCIVITVWVALAIAIAVLLIVLVLTILAAKLNNPVLKKCLCIYGPCLLIATVATIIVASIVLALPLIPITYIAIVIGILVALFVAMLLIMLCMFHCIFRGFCHHLC